MTELTIVRELRPGVWLAEAWGRRVLVRELAEERVATYRAAAELTLPVPEILYAGADRDDARQLVVEAVVGEGAADPEAGAWRSLAALESLFLGSTARLRTALARGVEALAWLHAARFVHGYLTPRSVHFHPGGGVCLTGLDCLQQAIADRVPCVAYSRRSPCVEQLEGWVVPATDVRLLGLALAEAYLGRHPLGGVVDRGAEPPQALARRDVKFDAADPVLRLVEQMCAIEPADRPPLRALLDALRSTMIGRPGRSQAPSAAAV